MSDCRFGVSPVNYPDPEMCVVGVGQDVHVVKGLITVQFFLLHFCRY